MKIDLFEICCSAAEYSTANIRLIIAEHTALSRVSDQKWSDGKLGADLYCNPVNARCECDIAILPRSSHPAFSAASNSLSASLVDS